MSQLIRDSLSFLVNRLENRLAGIAPNRTRARHGSINELTEPAFAVDVDRATTREVPDPPAKAIEAAISGLLAQSMSTRVAVIAPDSMSIADLSRWLTAMASSARVHVFAPAPSPHWKTIPGTRIALHSGTGGSQVHDVLKSLGEVDLILDLTGDRGNGTLDRWKKLYFHLVPGGLYVVSSVDGEAEIADEVRKLVSSLNEPLASAEKPAGGFGRDYWESTAATLATRTMAVIVKRHFHMLKLRDAEANKVLPHRESSVDVRELTVLPSGEFLARDSVIHHEADVTIDWPGPLIQYPDLHLRHYRGRIGYGSNTTAYLNSTILPESFRWHLAKNPSNPATTNSSTDFARLHDNQIPNIALEGDYYQLDPQHGGYGHIMTEVMGRLWGWDQAKAEIPNLKAIFSVKWPKKAIDSPKYKLLRAYGIDHQDIVWTDQPVWLDSLVGATDMWHNNRPYTVHPQLADVWHRVGSSLVDSETATFSKIFVSRGPKYRRRSCRNADQVEQIFKAYGFEVIYPEDWTMAQQAALFSNARAIAGFGGSGIFNILFAQKMEVAIILNHDSYYHRNEHLFTSLLGGEIHHFWSTADVRQDASGHNLAASESAWDFEVDRHQSALRQLLASI